MWWQGSDTTVASQWQVDDDSWQQWETGDNQVKLFSSLYSLFGNFYPNCCPAEDSGDSCATTDDATGTDAVASYDAGALGMLVCLLCHSDTAADWLIARIQAKCLSIFYLYLFFWYTTV